MTALRLAGAPVARERMDTARGGIAELITQSPLELAVVLVGQQPDALAYLKAIRRSCRSVGLPLRLIELPVTISAAELAQSVERLNGDPLIAGILVLQPLPVQIPAGLPAQLVAPDKDVDGVTIVSAGRLFAGLETLVPSTPAGGMAILEHYGVPIGGRRAVVLGRSMVVGRPMAVLLLAANATVTIAHSRSGDLPAITRQADILVAAVGRPGVVVPDMVKPGATVIDFGVNVVGGQLVGDVDPAVAAVAGALTPVPGGTGVVTNAILVSNVVKAARRQRDTAGRPQE